jgi:hypothetical protein
MRQEVESHESTSNLETPFFTLAPFSFGDRMCGVGHTFSLVVSSPSGATDGTSVMEDYAASARMHEAVEKGNIEAL